MDPPSLRRNRDFTALWAGQTVSALGTSTSSIAYPLLVLAVTGSAAQAGLVGTVLTATTLLLRLPAAALADRVDRRRTMLACDAVRFAAVGSLAVAVAAGRATLAHVLATAVCEAACGVLFAPAETVAVRRVVHPGQVRRAVAVGQSRQQLAGLLGPTLGGALFGWGRALPFAVDAVSYLASFAAVRSVRTPLPAGRPGDGATAQRPDVLAGVRWLWRRPLLRAACLWLAVAGPVFASLGIVTVVLAAELGATPAQTGFAFTLSGAGGLLGAVVAPRVVERVRPRALLVAYAGLAATATAGLLAASSVWVVGLLGAVAFFPVPAVNAAVTGRVVAESPDALQGRTVAAATQLTTLVQPLGPVLVGLALDAAGTGPVVVTCAGVFVVLAVAALLAPALGPVRPSRARP